MASDGMAPLAVLITGLVFMATITTGSVSPRRVVSPPKGSIAESFAHILQRVHFPQEPLRAQREQLFPR